MQHSLTEFKSSLERHDQMGDQLPSVPAPAFHPITIDFFARRNNKTTQLINTLEPLLALDGKRQFYNFEFGESVYIFELSVKATGYESWHDIEFVVEHVDGTRHEQSVRFDGTVARVAIGKLAQSFSIRPSKRFTIISSPKILAVVVNGLTLSEFHAYEWAIKDAEEREKRLKERAEKIAELDVPRK